MQSNNRLVPVAACPLRAWRPRPWDPSARFNGKKRGGPNLVANEARGPRIPVTARRVTGMEQKLFSIVGLSAAWIVKSAGRAQAGRANGGDSVEQEVFAVVRSCILQVLPDVDASAIEPPVSMRDLGANSVDRMEVVTMAMEQLKVRIPVAEFADVKNIGQLVQLYCRALAGARG
jgi:polyketide biosynthesis acyl carrier protein